MNNFFSSEHITTRRLKNLFIFILVSHFLIFDVWARFASKTEFKLVKDLHKGCSVSCINGLPCPNNNARGKNYDMDGVDIKETKNNCLITNWEMSHFFYHIIIGYYYNIQISTAVSLGFEFYEWLIFDCASFVDIIINLCGAITGTLLRIYL